MAALQYQPLHEAYLNDLQALWSNPAVIRYTGAPKPLTKEQTSYKLHCLQQSDVFIIVQHNIFAGIVGCPCIDAAMEQFGLFYQLLPSFWGQGHATAAVKWILSFMKEKYTQPIFYADVMAANPASEAILKHFHFICISESIPICYVGMPAIVRHYMLPPTI